MKAAIARCQGVFHVASPVPLANLTDPELDVVRHAVDGTKNVLEAASAAKVRRVVVVSSIVAVDINPKDWPTDKIEDENSWSDVEFCRNNEDWYSVSKITAEKAAHEYGEKTGLDVVILNPAVVFGPLLQPTVNASSQFLIYFLKGGPDQMRDKLWHIVDVRDTADALLLLYEAPEASGRHICAPHIITARNLRELLKRKYPQYPHISE
ncbi:cinnamoyl-CoA reductase 1-like [Lolium rigidum]|uniref:cinnamoyl-CoA reductase 1-like n=1 Tax=Lolium rigidum TaxID=89674 RepID=UPI001F5C6876|nr:cinnamoyl-CoA reductase 1-like [Lolium rigidum]